MLTKLQIPALLLFIVNAGFGQSGESRLPVLAPGIHNQRLPRTGEPVIHYAISIPSNYAPSKPVPLVLALHFGGNPNGAGRSVLGILVGPALAELGAIIVAPDSIGGGWSTPENERAVNTLLEAVLASYSIDTKKILVTGFSMGGAGVWHFAGKYPDRFSAAVPVAGRPPESAAGWRVPILAIHSRNDEVVPIGPAEARIAELKKAGLRADFIALTGISHYETNRFVDGLRRAVPWIKETWK
ncbi:MAG TPA: alpha/beta fold hydrolase [Terriglobia bacterium]|nr:alpha/beta fold hydrolase [Terriglobia bacterium]